MNFAGIGQVTATMVDGMVGVPVAGFAAAIANWWWESSIKCKTAFCTVQEYPQIFGLTIYSDEAAMVFAAMGAGGLAALVTHLAIRSQP